MEPKPKRKSSRRASAKSAKGKYTKPSHHERRPLTRVQVRRMGLIHQAIASGTYPNARTLAAQLEVSADAIRRDVRIMEMDLPIEYDYSRKGWYFTEPVTESHGLPITRSELIGALFLLQDTGPLKGTCWETAVESLCEKLAESFPDIVSFRPADCSKIISARKTSETIVTPENFELLVNAIADRQQLHVTYYNQQEEYSERDIEPHHIQNFEDNRYIVAYDHKHRTIRIFAAWRLSNMSKTGQTFTRQPGFDPDKHFANSLGIHAPEGPDLHDVVIRFSKRVAVLIRERRWNGQQKMVTLPDGSVELHLKLNGLLEASRIMLRWGPDVIGISPPALQAMHACNVQQMAGNLQAM